MNEWLAGWLPWNVVDMYLDNMGQRASKQRSQQKRNQGCPSVPPGPPKPRDSEGTRSDAIEEGCAFTGQQGTSGSDFIWAGSSLHAAAAAPSFPPASKQTNQPARSAAAVHCLRRVPTYKDRQAKEGATRHEGCAVPPNEINDNLLAAVPWLGLPSPHLSLPTLISGETVCRDSAAVHNRDYLLLSFASQQQPSATQHHGPVAVIVTVTVITAATTTTKTTKTTTGRHYYLNCAPSLMPSLLLPPRSSPDAAQRHSARS